MQRSNGRMFVLALCFLLTLASAGRSQKAPDVSKDQQLAAHFQELINGFVKSFNANKPEALSDLYASDAVLFPPNEPPVKGLTEITGYYKDRYLNAGFSDLVSTVYRVERSGNIAMQLNRWTIKVRQKDGKVIEDRGKTVNVWRLERNGKWRVIMDAWSSDLAAENSAVTRAPR